KFVLCPPSPGPSPHPPSLCYGVTSGEGTAGGGFGFANDGPINPAPVFFKNAGSVSPSPGGEGRDEGGRLNQFFPLMPILHGAFKNLPGGFTRLPRCRRLIQACRKMCLTSSRPMNPWSAEHRLGALRKGIE